MVGEGKAGMGQLGALVRSGGPCRGGPGGAGWRRCTVTVQRRGWHLSTVPSRLPLSGRGPTCEEEWAGRRSHQPCRGRVHCARARRPSCGRCRARVAFALLPALFRGGSPVDGVLSSRRQSERADVGWPYRDAALPAQGCLMPSWQGMGRSGPWVDTLLSLSNGHTAVGSTHP